jgi:succinate dehydrogenase / fumarate reductase, iron-sulfur subunit
MADHTHEHAGGRPPESFEVRILRQDGPGQASYWERFRVNYEPDMNVISVLQRIAARPVTTEGKQVTPVAWDSNCLEEVCGACTMLVNGRVRQSCSALVERLLEEEPEGIELQPMTRFPVLRDLVVDRTRLFRALTKIRGWVPVDGYYDMGPAPRQAPQVQEMRYPLSECMSCGCCLEACPQYNKIELDRREGETGEQFQQRKEAAYDRGFIGAHAISQVVYFNSDSIGKSEAPARLDALTSEGGVQVCGNAQNCVAVCPKEIPLTTSIARAGRAATVHSIKRWFDR